jgi:hypothetical protein
MINGWGENAAGLRERTRTAITSKQRTRTAIS